ncbi:MAG: acetyl-CoA carboxylase carboxyl transferase subunit alpha, partial [Evtepia sp.]
MTNTNSAFEKVKLARANQRPTGLDYIGGLFEDFFELHGDRRFSDDAAVVGGLGTLRGRAVT